jgi:hypothetical protein
VARRIILAIAAGIVALVLLYPVECSSSSDDPVNHCQSVLGVSLPGFSYRSPDEWRIYVVPLAGVASASFLAWRLTGRRRSADAATSRS